MTPKNQDIFNDKQKQTIWTSTDVNDVNVAYDLFHNKLSNIYNEVFPVINKTYKLHQNKLKPRITSCIIIQLMKK